MHCEDCLTRTKCPTCNEEVMQSEILTCIICSTDICYLCSEQREKVLGFICQGCNDKLNKSRH